MSTKKPSSDDKRAVRTDAARNRISILDVAEPLLTKHGARLSTDEVARRAQVGIGTVFRHFPTKSDLIHAIEVRRLERLTAEAQEWVEEGDPEGLFRFFEEVADAAAARKQALANALGAAGSRSPKAARAAADGLRIALGRLLEAAQAERIVRADVQAADVVTLLLAVVQIVGHAAGKRGERPKALTVLLDGLRFK